MTHASFFRCSRLYISVSIGAFAASSSLAYASATLPIVSAAPSALLQVDQNRTAIVDRVVRAWSGEIPAAQVRSFRNKLMTLRADQLLAASVSGSFDNVLEAIASNEKVALEKQFGARTGNAERAKSLGEPTRDLLYTPVAPCRFFDTRNAASGKMAASSTRDFDAIALSFQPQGGVAGNCEIDPAAVALAINFVVTDQAGAGFATVFAAGTSLPPASAINYPASSTQYAEANFGIFPICVGSCPADKELSVFTSESAHVLADVVGYFMPPSRAGDGLRIANVNAVSPNMIGGAAANEVRVGVRGAAIGGGGSAALGDPDYGADAPNRVTDNYGTIGGGLANRVGNDNANTGDAAFATVAGGHNNVAGGSSSFIGGGVDNFATGYISSVVGGEFNQASDAHAFVGGGQFNLASGTRSVIGGGKSNTAGGAFSGVFAGENNSSPGPQSSVLGGKSNVASGEASAVLAGINNLASGPASLAAGTNANAPFAGCFVWGDSLAQTVGCTAADQFIARSRGGVKFITGGTQSTPTGADLPSGSGAWTTLSDINAKTAIRKAKPSEVLAALMKLPVLTWQYKAQPGQVKHMGPSAQDFRAAFGLGETPLGISTVDADGVALAAIQGLAQKFAAQEKIKDAKITQLERELATIKKKLGL
jgi:Chaperone of endosialidase